MEKNTKVILVFIIVLILLVAYLIYASIPKDSLYNVEKGINPAKGNLSSNNIIVEFGDFKCPACKASHPIIEEILKEYNVALYYRNFPLPMHGQISFLAAEAAECANEQGKFWEYHNILYDNQELLSTKDDLKKYASDIELNISKFENCLSNESYKTEVEKDMADGEKFGIQGTPTFFVNGKRILGADKDKIVSNLK